MAALFRQVRVEASVLLVRDQGFAERVSRAQQRFLTMTYSLSVMMDRSEEASLLQLWR